MKQPSLKNYVKTKEEQLIVPTYTTKITDENIHLPGFEWLQAEYKTPGSSVSNALLSLANALITQRRLVFAYSRNSAQELVRNDQNYKKSDQVAFGNNKWTSVKKLMTMSDSWFELIQPGEGNSPSVFKVKHNFLRSFIAVDESAQLEETLKFVAQFKSKNSLQDSNRDREQDRALGVVDSNKNTVYSTVGDSKQSSGSAVTSCEPSLLESSVSTACAVTSINTQANPTSSPPVAPPPSPSAININPEDLKLVEKAEDENPGSEFVQKCRAALEKYGSLTEGRRKALSRTQPPSHTPTAKNSTTGLIDANKPMLSRDVAMHILENKDFDGERKVEELKKYCVDQKKKAALASLVSNYFVIRDVNEALFIVKELDLTPTEDELQRLEKRKIKNV